MIHRHPGLGLSRMPKPTWNCADRYSGANPLTLGQVDALLEETNDQLPRAVLLATFCASRSPLDA